MSEKRCPGCYDSFSGPWCDNCDQWPCKCSEDLWRDDDYDAAGVSGTTPEDTHGADD